MEPYVEGACLVAIDAPLIVTNPSGNRPAEAALNKAAEGINGLVDAPNREAIASSLQDVRHVAAELKTTQARADALLVSLNATVDENRPELRQTVLDLEQTVGAIASRIDAITHHLESSSRNIDEFAREIRRNPNRLLFTPKADEVEPE